MNSMICPRCHSRAVGRVGVDQYYCADCCVEFIQKKNQLRLYEVDPEGSLVALSGEQRLG